MKYAMVLAGVGALLLATPVLAAPSHHTDSGTTLAMNDRSDHFDRDRDRDELNRLLDDEFHKFFHNPHCDPDDRDGPDGDRDDKAAHNPGHGHHFGRCRGKPMSP